MVINGAPVKLMIKNRYVQGIAFLLLSILVVSVSIGLLNDSSGDQAEYGAIEFSAPLNLTNERAVESSIISYLVNRDSEDDIIKIHGFETVDGYYNISIELGAVRELNEAVHVNQTGSSLKRFFSATYMDLSNPLVETSLSGWIDENRKVSEWDVLQLHWVNSSTPGMWVPHLDAPTRPVTATVEANNRFALELYGQLSEMGGNVLFSPYSISTALSMVYEGARGVTAQEMQAVFHFNENETARLGENQYLYKELNDDRQGSQLDIANALWVQDEYPVEAEYLRRVTEYYYGEARNLDFMFSPDESRITINDWVEEKTNDKINDLFPDGSIGPDTCLVLTNAVYFKGNWVHPFRLTKTEPRPFYVTPVNPVQVDTMYLSNKHFNYSSVDGIQVLELPYANSSLSMVILFPQNRTLAEVEGDLSTKLDHWLAGLTKNEMEIYLPKFSFESKYSLKETLSNMGMPTAFTKHADFTGINGDGRLYIDSVVHQAFIEVNEEGTEAAAATGVTIITYGGYIGEVFRADHPFIFIIRDRQTGTNLFMGRVHDPTP